MKLKIPLLIWMILIIVGTISVSANVIKRGEDYNIYKINDLTYTTTISAGPINYYNGIEYVPIDTTIVPSSEGYEVTKGIYKTYFKQNPIEVKLQRDNNYLIFKPISLNYGDKSVEIKSTSGSNDKNKLTYSNLFGEDIHFEYNYLNDQLKENIIIDNIKALSELNNDLEIKFLINFNLDLYVDKDKWDEISTIETSKSLLFKENDKEIFYLPKAYAFDSNNQEQLLSYIIKKENDNLYLIIKIPYSFLKDATYPVLIDPSVSISHEDKGRVDEDGGNQWADIEINSYSVKDRRCAVRFSLISLPGYKATTLNSAYINIGVTSEDMSSNCDSGAQDTEIYYKSSDSWGGSSLSWSDVTPTGDVLDTRCLDGFAGIRATFDVLGNGVHGVMDDYEKGGNKSSFIFKIKTEGLNPAKGVNFEEDPKLNITYTLANLTLNPAMYLNDAEVWSYSGYFSNNETASFTQELNDALQSCTPDANGYCDIPFIFHSDAEGSLKINNINVYFNITEYKWNTSSMPEGTNYRVRVKSTDGSLNSSWDESDSDFTIMHGDNPVVNLINPIDNQYSINSITFNVSATDNVQLSNCTLYTNINGWGANDTKTFTGSYDSDIWIWQDIPKGTYIWNALCYDINGNSAWYETNYTFTVYEIGENKFYVKNSTSNVAFFDDKGNLVLRGICTSGGTCISSDNSFIVKNNAGEETANIDQYGNLCIETGDCSDLSSSCNPANDAYIIKNETGSIVSYIDTTGDLCLTGVLVEYGTP